MFTISLLFSVNGWYIYLRFFTISHISLLVSSVQLETYACKSKHATICAENLFPSVLAYAQVCTTPLDINKAGLECRDEEQVEQMRTHYLS